MRKKLTRAFLLVFCFAFVFAGATLALTGPGSTSKDIRDKVKIPEVKKILEDQEAADVDNQINFGEFLTNNFTGLQALTVTSLTTGNVEDGCTSKDNCKLSGGFLGTTSQLMADMYLNPAASGQTYLADLFDSAGIAQPAYAQGLGFASLNPVLNTWKIFRNIAYFFFVIIFVVIGFMIMFRQKISGQAVVTAQQAIPSIIIALVLVTFSYAIAGFLIDIMYLFMFFLVNIFQKDEASFIDGNFLQLASTIIRGNTVSVGESVGAFVNDSLGGGILSNLAGIVSGLFVAVIFAVAIAIGMFRLFFNLLKRYVAIVLSIATAPLILMIGAIPGKNTFGPWLKGIVGNLAAFPILLLALIISDSITGNFSGSQNAISYGGFMPPYLGGVGSGGTLSFLLGLGILLILSELVDKGAQALGAGKGPFDDLVNAAQKNLMAGAPIGTKALATLGGAGAGLIAGEIIGRRDSEGVDADTRRRRINATRLRYAGNFANAGAKLGGKASSALGGSTPGAFKILEKGIDTGTGVLTEDAQIKRAGTVEGGLFTQARNLGSRSTVEFDRQLEYAESEKKRKLEIEKLLAEGKIDDARKLSVIKD